MATWKNIIVVGLATAVGFGVGQRAPQDVTLTATVQPAGIDSNSIWAEAATSLYSTEAQQVTSESLGSRLSVGESEATNQVLPELNQINGRSVSDAMHAGGLEPLTEGNGAYNADAELAYQDVQLLVAERMYSGQWDPEQDMAIYELSQQLSQDQRDEILDIFVGAMNRGEIDASIPLPPI